MINHYVGYYLSRQRAADLLREAQSRQLAQDVNDPSHARRQPRRLYVRRLIGRCIGFPDRLLNGNGPVLDRAAA